MRYVNSPSDVGPLLNITLGANGGFLNYAYWKDGAPNPSLVFLGRQRNAYEEEQIRRSIWALPFS